ncbi:uncharacterized protein LOC143469068 isoform X1 [Clavelina lepadiformis]|uniref:uncharacterized protein LOC143469068 isoform X1 n=1 Tax=Clavelina lepadiformis TaxID=159417 RepID=UPI004040F5A2
MEQQLWRHISSLNEYSDGGNRSSVYKSIEKLMKASDVKNSLQNKYVHQFLAHIMADLKTEDEELTQAALAVLCLLFSENLMSSLEREYEKDLLTQIVEILEHSKGPFLLQKTLCIIITKQNFSQTVMELFVKSILSALSVSNTSSDTVIIDVINRLLQQSPRKMQEHMLLWLKITLELTANNSVIIRQLAVTTIKANLSLIQSKRKQILPVCGSFLKQKILTTLKSLATKKEILQEILSAQLPVYMNIIGEDLKRSASLSNLVLHFMEKGFRHADDDIRLTAFKTWDCLIECFSANKELLSTSKYVKLLTEPLKLKIKSEALLHALIGTMWKLAVYLDDKLPDLFEVLCSPLLEICFGDSSTPVKSSRRSSGRLSLRKQVSPYRSIQVLGAEILIRLLCDVTNLNYPMNLSSLRKPWIKAPSTFARFFSEVMRFVCDATCYLHKILPAEIFLHLWKSLVECTHDNVVRKRDVEMFRCLYQSVHRIVSCDVTPTFLLAIISYLTSFPTKILNSSLHSTSEISAMHGTPILSIFQFLLSPHVCVEENIKNPKFLACAELVICYGLERKIGTLEYVRAVITHLCFDNDIYIKMWNCLCKHTLDYVLKTQNINQGDSLENDFTAIHSLLLFPVEFFLQRKSSLDFDIIDLSTSLWMELLKHFLSFSSLVTKSDSDEERTFLLRHILCMVQKHKLVHLSEEPIGFFEKLLLALIDDAKFLNENIQRKLPASKKYANNDTSSLTTNGFNAIITELLLEFGKVSLMDNKQLPPNILPCLKTIFRNVPQDLVASNFHSFMELFSIYLNIHSNKTWPYQIDVEETWNQVLSRLQLTDTNFEDDVVCDLFLIAFSHPSQSIYHTTVNFWKMKIKDFLDITSLNENFKSTLLNIYEKEGFAVTRTLSSVDSSEVDGNVSTESWESDIEHQSKVSQDEITEASGDVSILSTNTEDDNVFENVNNTQIPSPVSTAKACLSLVMTCTNDKSGNKINNNAEQTCVVKQPQTTRQSARLRKNNYVQLAGETKKKKVDNNEDRTTIGQHENPYHSEQTGNLGLKEKHISSNDGEEDNFDKVQESSQPVTNSSTSSSNVIILESEDEELFSECQNTVDGSAADDENDNISYNTAVDYDTTRVDSDMSVNSVDDTRRTTCSPMTLSSEPSPTHTDSVNANGSIFEVVEMAEISVCPAQQSQDKSFATAQACTNSGGAAVLSSKTLNHTDERSINGDHHEVSLVSSSPQPTSQIDESVYEVVEMAEMSVYVGRQLEDQSAIQQLLSPGAEQDNLNVCKSDTDINSTSSNEMLSVISDSNAVVAETTSQHDENNSTSKNGDRSMYEVVEMAEMSINPEVVCDTNNSESELYANEALVNAKKNIGVEELIGSKEVLEMSLSSDISHGTMDTSIEKSLYEVVQMVDLSSSCVDPVDRAPIETSTPFSADKEKQPVSSNNDSFNVCAKDLDIHPLDCSFEAGDEPKEEKPKDNLIGDTITPVCLNNRPTDEESSKDSLFVNTETKNKKIDVVVSLNRTQCSKFSETNTVKVQQSSLCPDPHIRQCLTAADPATILESAVLTPKSCLRKRLISKDAYSSPNDPLKEGMTRTNIMDEFSPATKSRRVSFAEPISTSAAKEDILPISPTAIPVSVKNKFHPRVVNRRLSLPAPKRTLVSPRLDVTRSPLSVRSASVAAAIAGIKARNTESPVRPGQTSLTSQMSLLKSLDFNNVTVSKLIDLDYLNNLSTNDLENLTQFLLTSTPVIHSVLMQKLKNHAHEA